MAAQVVFALAPGFIAPDNLHDYSDPKVIKLYKEAVESLPTKFDVKPENLKVFLSELELRASCSGWKYMFDIQVDEDDEEEKVSLLTEYGRHLQSPSKQ
jgi:hypothetical protein